LHEKTLLQSATLKVKLFGHFKLKLWLDKQESEITPCFRFLTRLLSPKARNNPIGNWAQSGWRGESVSMIPALDVGPNGFADTLAIRRVLQALLSLPYEQVRNGVFFGARKTPMGPLDHASLSLTDLADE
jgi:hypothetical protein